MTRTLPQRDRLEYTEEDRDAVVDAKLKSVFCLRQGAALLLAGAHSDDVPGPIPAGNGEWLAR